SAIARAMARAGAAVAALDSDADTLRASVAAVEAAGGRAASVLVDVSSQTDVVRAFDEATDALGPVDILVNTAFVARLAAPEELELEDWQLNLDINLT